MLFDSFDHAMQDESVRQDWRQCRNGKVPKWLKSYDPCGPSLGSLEDISPAQIYRADLTSVVSSFFPSILLFSVFLFLCSTFPVFYFLPFSSVFLCISSTFSFCLSCLSFTFLLCLLSFSSSSNFLCLPSNFSFCFYLFLYLLLSFFAFFYFHSLSVFYSIPLTLFFILLRICVCALLLLLLLLLLSFLSSCSSFLYLLPIF